MRDRPPHRPFRYGRAVLLADAQQRAIPNWEAKRSKYAELQAEVDQTCTGEKHKFLVGHDCYELASDQEA